MISHAPPNYRCPFCLVAARQADPSVFTVPDDIVLSTSEVTVFVSSHWWPNNPGHVIVIPNRHFENIYDLPNDVALAIHVAAREVALAMKRAYGCPGISTRQHNEPAGDQEVWHYHLHVFPRFDGDQLYRSDRRLTSPEERLPYAELLRAQIIGRTGS